MKLSRGTILISTALALAVVASGQTAGSSAGATATAPSSGPSTPSSGPSTPPPAVSGTTPRTDLLPDNVVFSDSWPAPVLRPSGRTELASTTGETALTLDVGNGIRYVPPSRVTVPAGEMLRVTGPAFGGRAVQWMKDGRPLAGATATTLVISSVRPTDAGTYFLASATAGSSSIPSQSLILGIGPTDRLLNLSLRGTIAAGSGQMFTAGFVVAAGTGQSKKIILRAVGPTLASFGVSGVLRAPVLRVFDSAGNPYEAGYGYAAIVGGLTYETDLADSLARAGAFPIPTGTLDAVVMMPFLPGAYTVQVTSGDNTAGAVLVEVYEVP